MLRICPKAADESTHDCDGATDIAASHLANDPVTATGGFCWTVACVVTTCFVAVYGNRHTTSFAAASEFLSCAATYRGLKTNLFPVLIN